MYRKMNQQTSRSQTIANIAARAGVSVPTVLRVLHHRPDVAPQTAIFAGSDLQATSIYNALRARGIPVPDMISVVGFDDVPIASIANPALTTVRQPLIEMGRVATTMLLRQIAQEPLDHPRIELATNLVVRESCAPVY